MQIEVNGMELEILKSWYNKTKVQSDGITHIVDTETQYPVYQFGMAKNYFDVDNKIELLESLITDFDTMKQMLEQQLEKERELNEGREIGDD